MSFLTIMENSEADDKDSNSLNSDFFYGPNKRQHIYNIAACTIKVTGEMFPRQWSIKRI